MRKNGTNTRRQAREERLKKEREERFSRFDAACAALCGQGYTQRDKTLPPRRAGTLGILTAAPFAIAAIVGGLFLPDLHFLLTGSLFADAALFLVLLLASIPAHEGLHALGWAAVSGTFRGLRFGLADGSPYCACEKPLCRWKYLVGALLPLAVLGLGLSAAGLCLRTVPLFVLGAFNIACAGGDILVSARAAASPGLLLDHPERCGFYQFCRPPESARGEEN